MWKSLIALLLMIPAVALADAPVVTGISPASGLPNTRVKITGSHFLGVTTVKFADSDFGTSIATFTVISDQLIAAYAPYSVIDGPITVSSPAGTSTSPTFTVTPVQIGRASLSGVPGATGTGRFSALGGSHAVLYLDLDAAGLAASSFYLVSAITGGCSGNFDYGFGSFPTNASGAGSLHTSDRYLSIQIGQIMSSHSLCVGGGPIGCSICGPITSLYAPSLSSFAPASGPAGTPVTLSGGELSGVTLVTFDGVAAQFSIVSPSEILAIVPIGAADGPIGVQSPSGVRYSWNDFVVMQPTRSARASWGQVKARYQH